MRSALYRLSIIAVGAVVVGVLVVGLVVQLYLRAGRDRTGNSLA